MSPKNDTFLTNISRELDHHFSKPVLHKGTLVPANLQKISSTVCWLRSFTDKRNGSWHFFDAVFAVF
jgi:hypothetical protein